MAVRGINLRKATLAAAISLAVGSAHADAVSRAKFRLALEDEISSRPDAPLVASSDGRIEVDGLIQSHPDPLYVALEARYEALPPFTAATEQTPQQLIAEATLRERLTDGIKSIAGDVPRFVPRISSSVRQDTIETDGPDGPLDSSVMIASINPTVEYNIERRKWRLNTTYNLNNKQYYGDRRGSTNDHYASADWTLNLSRGNVLEVSSNASKTHDLGVRDPIVDFDSLTKSNDLEQKRYLVNVNYRRGAAEDRTRYNVFVVSENSSISAEEFINSGYRLTRNGFGGAYVWQAKRQLALVAEGRYQRLDYDLGFRDNDHYQTLIGSDLVFGRRIRARVRVGYEGKNFEDAVGTSSFGRPVWEGSLEWALRRKTTVKLETGREVFELVENDQQIDTNNFNVRNWVKAAWNEHWTDKLSTQASYTFRDHTAVGAIDTQDDSAHQLIVSAGYQFSERLRFSLDGAITQQDSDIGEQQRRHTFTLRADYSLSE